MYGCRSTNLGKLRVSSHLVPVGVGGFVKLPLCHIMLGKPLQASCTKGRGQNGPSDAPSMIALEGENFRMNYGITFR
jgi:hypothetical protein